MLAALLLSQISGYDWQFPAEHTEIEAQMGWLRNIGSAATRPIMANFAALRLSPELTRFPWAQQPVVFVEKLTAWLWSADAIDAFHAVAISYVAVLDSIRANSPPAEPRLCIVLIGRGAQPRWVRLFEKLRPHGTYFSQVDPQHGIEQALCAAHATAKAHPDRCGHWYMEMRPLIRGPTSSRETGIP